MPASKRRLAAARLGLRTVLLTMNADSVAQMSCNPAIGGVAKGQIVREIDALGGEMGKVIDASRHSVPHAQPHQGPGHALAAGPGRQEALSVHDEAARRGAAEPDAAAGDWSKDLLDRSTDRPRRIVGVRRPAATRSIARAAVILTTGTFLKALMHMGEAKTRGGRAGDQSAEALSDSLAACGFELARFKTGTPCRLNGRTIDFAQTASRSPATPSRGRSASPPSASRSRRWIATSPTRTKRSTT